MIKKIRSPNTLAILFLLALLLGLYIHGLLQFEDIAHIGVSLLYFLAILKINLNKKNQLETRVSIPSASLGIFILGLIIWQFFDRNVTENFLRAMPLLSGIGIVLTASRFNFIGYWRELTILFFLGIPKLVISAFYDPSPLTAKFASLALWYFGFDSRIVNEVYVMLPEGGVKVFEPCSGLESVCYVLGLSIICLILYPISSRFLRWLVPLVASITGFTVNLFRVILLTLLSAWQQKSSFVYWHEGEGSLIFGIIAVMIFSLFYYFLPQENPSQTVKT